jgi:release factor glutamine methyltransferase
MTAGDESPAAGEVAGGEAEPDRATGDPDAVYDPAEDSMLLAETAVARTGADDIVLDVGTGSGVVAARVRAETSAQVLGVDLNPHACRVARARSRPGVPAGDGTPLPVVRGDLTDPIREGVADLVAFNPPYLPEPDGAAGSDAPSGDPPGEGPQTDADPADDWLRTAYAGGTSGRAIIGPFLDTVARVLAPGGRVLLLVSTLTGIDEVRDRARGVGFDAEQVAAESIPFETLVVLELAPA